MTASPVTPLSRQSPVLKDLERFACNPQGEGGTDWTAIGSDGDESVAADRATGISRSFKKNEYFGACHKVWYPDEWVEAVARNKKVTHRQVIGHNAGSPSSPTGGDSQSHCQEEGRQRWEQQPWNGK